METDLVSYAKKAPQLNSFIQNEKTFRSALERLFSLRNIAIISQLIVIIIVVWVLELDVNISPFLWVTGTLIAINLFIYWRIKQDWTTSSLEVTSHLLIDIVALAILLYFAGGSTNPLVSLFIIPVALSAIFLPLYNIILIAAITIFLYSLLMEWYIPLPSMGTRFGGDFNLHIMGMYGNFILSAILIATFVFILVRIGRYQEQELAIAREKLIRNRHIVETSLLAAHAAHKINTPLATIGLLVEELIASPENNKKQDEQDLKEIQQQINYCQNQLWVLQEKASDAKRIDHTPSTISLTLEQSLLATLNEWGELHPEIQLNINIKPFHYADLPEITNLAQILVNVLDNAAHASLHAKKPSVDVKVTCKDEHLIIDIDDYGEGLTAQQLKHIGRKPYSSKPDGMGIGLLLSHSTLDQLGGHIVLNNRDETQESGIRARIIVPLIKRPSTSIEHD